MTGEPLLPPRAGDLDDSCALAYRHAVTHGRYTRQGVAEGLGTSLAEATRIEEVLRSLSLLSPMPGEPGAFVPVSPNAAAADLLGPAESRIHELQQAVTEARARMRALEPAYFESRRRRNEAEAFDIVSDIGVLQSMLNDWGARCRSEILTAQPGGPRPGHHLDKARPRMLARLARGVTVRHLYQHTVRSDLATTAYVREVAARGAQVRTTDQLIDRILIYDREIAFLPEQNVSGRQPGAVVVREPMLVAFLFKVYEHLWAAATPFSPGAEEPVAVTDDLKRSIVRLMAQGHKDEVVARRLGMSVRTCRRYISQIMEELESTSRFQAGVSAASSGMLDCAEDLA